MIADPIEDSLSSTTEVASDEDMAPVVGQSEQSPLSSNFGKLKSPSSCFAGEMLLLFSGPGKELQELSRSTCWLVIFV